MQLRQFVRQRFLVGGGVSVEVATDSVDSELKWSPVHPSYNGVSEQEADEKVKQMLAEDPYLIRMPDDDWDGRLKRHSPKPPE